MTIEYSAEDDGFKEITIDTYEDIKLASNQSKYFKISGEIESFSKITRLSGFPSILMKKCEHKEQWLQCKEDFKLSEQKGQPIITKTESLREEPCPHCLTLFRFSSEQPVELSFHLQSKNSPTELKEKVTMSDFLNEHESNKYEVHVLKGEDLMANIHVQEGNVEVHLTDYAGVNLMKKSISDQRVLQFHVKAAEDKEKEKINPGVHADTFSVYHFTVTSVNEEKAASYTIGYSSGSS